LFALALKNGRLGELNKLMTNDIGLEPDTEKTCYKSNPDLHFSKYLHCPNY
jgi:hypothetical protein